MIKLAIRDDDLNAFTKLKDIVKLYEPIGKFPISFAVIPYVTDVLGGCPETKGNKTPCPLDSNEEIVSWLRESLSNKKCDVLLHGITHEYHFDRKGGKIPEMVWRNGDNVVKAISDSKAYLQALLNCKITCFVAPNNIISKQSLDAVVRNDLDFSGIIPVGFQRGFTFRNVSNYCKRFIVRGLYNIQYPGVLDYGNHLEINACGLRSLDYLKKIFDYCQKKKLPMVLNVHYWNLRDNVENRNMLFEFVKYALDNNANPSVLSKILSDYKHDTKTGKNY